MVHNKEKHKRIPKHKVNVMKYKPLIMKILHKMGKRYGQYVFDYKEELIQEGYMGLLTAKKDYNPSRGTFVTLAYLRVSTFMFRTLNKASKEHVRKNYLEDLSHGVLDIADGGDELTWEDMFPSNQIDYDFISNMAIKDNIDRKILKGLSDGVSRRELPKFLGLSIKDTDRRFDELRGEMVSICNELYESH